MVGGQDRVPAASVHKGVACSVSFGCWEKLLYYCSGSCNLINPQQQLHVCTLCASAACFLLTGASSCFVLPVHDECAACCSFALIGCFISAASRPAYEAVKACCHDCLHTVQADELGDQ